MDATETTVRAEAMTVVIPDALAGLPVSKQIDAVNLEDQNIIFLAQTGSGKTMVVAALEALQRKARGEKFQIWMRQPTKLTCSNVLGGLRTFWESAGLSVGISTREKKENIATADIVVYSDGSLFQAMRPSERKLITYFDEVHWMSNINTELEIALCLKNKVPMRLLSATIDPQPLVTYLGGAQVHRLEGRVFPITKHVMQYNPDALESSPNSFDSVLTDCITDVQASNERALVFLRTKQMCEDYAKHYADKLGIETTFAHGEVKPTELEAWVREHKDGSFVIFATTAASTGITIDVHCVYIVDEVVDSDMVEGVQRQFTRPVDDNMLLQMAGRAGRLRPGDATLVTTEDNRQDWDWSMVAPRPIKGPCAKTTPYNVILAMASHGVKADSDIKLFSQLNPSELRHAREWLTRHNCLEQDGSLTRLGQRIQRLPLSAQYGHLVLTAPGTAAQVAVCAGLTAALAGTFSLVQVKPGSKRLHEIRMEDPTFPLLPADVIVQDSMPLTLAKLMQRAYRARSRENDSETLRSWAEDNNISHRALNLLFYNFENMAENIVDDPRRALLDVDFDDPEFCANVNQHVVKHPIITRIPYQSGREWSTWFRPSGAQMGAVLDSLALDVFDLNPMMSGYDVCGLPKVIRSRKTGNEFASLEFAVITNRERPPQPTPVEEVDEEKRQAAQELAKSLAL